MGFKIMFAVFFNFNNIIFTSFAVGKIRVTEDRFKFEGLGRNMMEFNSDSGKNIAKKFGKHKKSS